MCIMIKIMFLIVLRQSSFESPHVAMINYFTNYIDLLQHLKNHNILNLLTFQAPLNNSFSFITMDPFLKKKKKASQAALHKCIFHILYFHKHTTSHRSFLHLYLWKTPPVTVHKHKSNSFFLLLFLIFG